MLTISLKSRAVGVSLAHHMSSEYTNHKNNMYSSHMAPNIQLTPFLKGIIRTHGFEVSAMSREDRLKVVITGCISMMSLDLFPQKK